MLPFLIFGVLGAALRRQAAAAQLPQALDVPQSHDLQRFNAPGAPTYIAPVALADRVVAGQTPAQAAGGLPTSLGPIPPLSHLTVFEFVEDTPAPFGPVEAVQINPWQDRIGYGPIR